ncbi:MAG: dihydrofolate reductase family protein [Thermoplasmata archaeon]|nr:dihydrofolate reductase family protein [Thermoplasmata archaeon]
MALAGPRISQAFLAHDLVDEMLLRVFPILVGRGRPRFPDEGDPNHDTDVVPIGPPGRDDFKLVDSRPQRDGSHFVHSVRAEPTNLE